MGDLITHSHDQAMIIPEQGAQDIFNKANEIVQSAITTGNVQQAFSAILNLRSWTQLAGLTIAYIIYELRGKKEEFGFEDDNEFLDAAAAQTGYAYQTLKKYVQVWEYVILGCPQELRIRFLGFPIEHLWLMTPAAKSNELDSPAWHELSLAPDKGTVKSIIRRIRGTVTSSDSAILITIDRGGYITAYQGDEIEELGMLNLKKESKLAMAAITRIVKSAGMIGEGV